MQQQQNMQDFQQLQQQVVLLTAAQQNLNAPGVMNSTQQQAQGLQDGQGQPSPSISVPLVETWMQWFCSLEGHEFVLQIPREFLKDKFNLVCLGDQIQSNLSQKRVAQCYQLICDGKAPTQDDLASQEYLQMSQEASEMYGLIH